MKTLKPTISITLFILFSTFVTSQTYTTVQDGPWTDASTWNAGAPPTNLSNDVININHRVTHTGTLKLQGNNTLNVNYILRIDAGSIEIEQTTDVVNIDYGLVIMPNGIFLNKNGTVNLNYGRIQLCNSDYKDESSAPRGTFGIGDMYANNGTIEDSNPGNFSTDIEWCSTDGSAFGLPGISENCPAVAPPPGFLCTDELLYQAPTIDFDGVDDYMDSNTELSGLQNASLMAWVKLDSAFSNQAFIMGQGNFDILITSQRRIRVTANGRSITANSSNALLLNTWAHVAAVYEASHATEKLRIFINGKKIGTVNNGGNIGSPLTNSSNNFTIGKLPSASSRYFKGNIDEARVFDIALTDSQLRQMIHQEIEEIGGNVCGTIIPKPIKDQDTDASIQWDNLIAYYPMTRGINGLGYAATLDASKFENKGQLYNMTTNQDQTAPMPYVTINDGLWTNTNVWQHGNVWDIETSHNDWAIIKIDNDIETSSSHTALGLIISNTANLTVNNDNVISNNWYLELNGTLNLLGDSQLIQTSESDLVTDTDGKILRKQEGTNNIYWYNYFGSPVGATGVTNLTDNNSTGNNTNNASFNMDMLKDDTGVDIEFTNALAEAGKLSTRWFYTFQNAVEYSDWVQFNTTTAITAGVGYIHKGTGVSGSEQSYLFEGKPNNGTIVIPAIDTGGAGSVPAISKTEYLLANPYPSAIDIHQFIDDNAGVIEGTLKLWQQWSGSSHILNNYNGGYALVNKLGSTRAYQFVGIEGANNGSQDGTLTPTRYLPVAQGFITEIVANGNIVFNNTQRVFIKESDADGDYGNGSVFFKSNQVGKQNENNQTISKIRLEFNAIEGPSRELILGFSSTTSDDFDYGYDALNNDLNNTDDLNLSFGDDKRMLMQAYAEITPHKIVPLIFNASGNYLYSIGITDIRGIDENQDIYLKDKYQNIHIDLRESEYNFTSIEGEFNDRFEIVFPKIETVVTPEEVNSDIVLIYFNNLESRLYVTGFGEEEVSEIVIYNILGQSVKTFSNEMLSDIDSGLTINTLSTGTYLVKAISSESIITKKILVN